MKKKGNAWLLVISVIAIFISSSASVEADDNTGTFTVSTGGGRISVEADNAPLSTILNELSRKTGAQFTDRTTYVQADILSISFSSLPFPEAIARILKNYSYILDGDSAPHVIILASLPSRENPSASEAIKHETEPERKVSAGVNRVVFQAEALNADECQALEFTEKEASQSRAQLTKSPNSQSRRVQGKRLRAVNEREAQYLNEKEEEIRKRLEDAKIKRAQKVLGMGKCSNFWEQVLNDMSGIQDGRVTALLSDTALNGETKELKEKAAKALWRNAAGSEFKNTADLDALNRLTSSGDPDVSMIAQQALRDYKSYVQRD